MNNAQRQACLEALRGKASQMCVCTLHLTLPGSLAWPLCALQVPAGRKHVRIMGVEPVGSYAIRYLRIGQ